MSESVCIVGGCGRKGLPFGIAIARAGGEVTLLDIDGKRLKEVAQGRIPAGVVARAEELSEAIAARSLQVSAAAKEIADHDIVVLAIDAFGTDQPSELAKERFERAVDDIFDHMHSGQLLLLRGLALPNLTERLHRQAYGLGLNLAVAYCPPPMDTGAIGRGAQIVAGVNHASAERATAFFESIGSPTIRVAPLEAELAEAFAIARQQIDFAVANQFAILADQFGIDYRAVNKLLVDRPQRSSIAAAGGADILAEIALRTQRDFKSLVLTRAARGINNDMPQTIVDIVRSKRTLSNDVVAILGMADVEAGERPESSFANKLRMILTFECKDVLCTDPYIDHPALVTLDEALENADVVIVGAGHPVYRDADVWQPCIDIFGVLGPPHQSLLGGSTQRPTWPPLAPDSNRNAA